MTPSILNKYLDRIGFSGQPQPDLATLKQLCERHTRTFAFEGLSPFTGMPVLIDTESIAHKFLDEHRGGYCFEQNGLLKEVLQALGFSVRALLGKVYHKGETIANLRRTHETLLVRLGSEQYLTDVGFGGLVPTHPLHFVLDVEQKTPREFYKIEAERAHFVLSIKRQGQWDRLYLFDLQEQYEPDFRVANWYTSTYPQSGFTNRLLTSIVGEDCRYTLNDNRFGIHFLDQEPEYKTLTTVAEIREVLQQVFKLHLGHIPNLDQRLGEMLESKEETKTQ